MSYIDRVMDMIADEERRMRWYIRYEQQYPKYTDFRAAVTPSKIRIRSAGDVYADAKKLMDMKWKEMPADGEWN